MARTRYPDAADSAPFWPSFTNSRVFDKHGATLVVLSVITILLTND